MSDEPPPRFSWAVVLTGLGLIGALTVFAINMGGRIATIETLAATALQRADQQQDDLREIGGRLREIELGSVEATLIMIAVRDAVARIEKRFEESGKK